MINRELTSLFILQKRSFRSQSHCLCHCFTWGKTLSLPQSLLHLGKDAFAPTVTASLGERLFRSHSHCFTCRNNIWLPTSLFHMQIFYLFLNRSLRHASYFKKTLSLSTFRSSYAKRPSRSLRHVLYTEIPFPSQKITV